MGVLLRYIADELASKVETGACPVCQRQAPLFPVQAAIGDDEWLPGDDCPELCVDCIRSLPLDRFTPRRSERIIQQMVNAHHPRGTLSGEERNNRIAVIREQFRRTPPFPLFLQDEDWPWCCGDFCEYLGVPASYDESIRVGAEMEFWEGDFRERFGDMTLEPESLNEVCLFRCLTCDRRLFTWQMT
jgi:uncharacterized protein CbrC (UPF0167 family)